MFTLQTSLSGPSCSLPAWSSGSLAALRKLTLYYQAVFRLVFLTRSKLDHFLHDLLSNLVFLLCVGSCTKPACEQDKKAEKTKKPLKTEIKSSELTQNWLEIGSKLVHQVHSVGHNTVHLLVPRCDVKFTKGHTIFTSTGMLFDLKFVNFWNRFTLSPQLTVLLTVWSCLLVRM